MRPQLLQEQQLLQLVLQLVLLLSSAMNTTSTFASQIDNPHIKIECNMNAVLWVQKGDTVILTGGVEACFILFSRPNQICCSGDREGCHKLTSGGSCKSNTDYNDRDPSTCSIYIGTANEENEGLYQIYNADGDFVKGCHLFLRNPSHDGQSDQWREICLMVLCFLSGMVFACTTTALILFKMRKRPLFINEERKGVLRGLISNIDK